MFHIAVDVAKPVLITLGALKESSSQESDLLKSVISLQAFAETEQMHPAA